MEEENLCDTILLIHIYNFEIRIEVKRAKPPAHHVCVRYGLIEFGAMGRPDDETELCYRTLCLDCDIDKAPRTYDTSDLV